MKYVILILLCLASCGKSMEIEDSPTPEEPSYEQQSDDLDSEFDYFLYGDRNDDEQFSYEENPDA